VISPIAIAQHGTDYKNYLRPSVGLSVCLSALLRSQFSLDFDEILTEVGARKVRMFRWRSKSDDLFPYFAQFFTPIMQFQWEGQNSVVTRPVDRLWRLRAQTTCL